MCGWVGGGSGVGACRASAGVCHREVVELEGSSLGLLPEAGPAHLMSQLMPAHASSHPRFHAASLPPPQVLLNVLADEIHRAHQRCLLEDECDPNRVGGGVRWQGAGDVARLGGMGPLLHGARGGGCLRGCLRGQPAAASLPPGRSPAAARATHRRRARAPLLLPPAEEDGYGV